MNPHTTRRGFLAAIGSAGAIAALRALSPFPPTAQPGFKALGAPVHRHQGWALGATVSIAIADRDADRASDAARAAFAELERIESIMSLYRPDSELARLNAAGFLARPSPELVEILEAARWVSLQSDGSFDITVQPAMAVHLAAHRARRAPDPAELSFARSLVDWRRVSVAPDRVELGAGMAISLNGIAQGYATDRARSALVRAGVRAATVEAGELATIGADTSGAPWVLGVQDPEVVGAHLARLTSDGRCAATSGQYTRSMGKAHILDPATGAGARGLSSATVLAPLAWLADALSTAIFAAGPDRAASLLEAFADTDALLVLESGRTIATPGLSRLLLEGPTGA